MMIDLRSDFLSSATAPMLAAMQAAAGQPKGYGPREDPHQRELEETAAEMLGKEDALFLPTCLMANLLAVMSVARRGDAVLMDANSHVITSESGALAAMAGVVTLPLPSQRGMVALPSIEHALSEGSIQQPRSTMLLLENTHNKAGGLAIGAAYFRDVRQLIGKRWLHLDGSRIFNAAIALGETPAALVKHADSVAFSLNKGLAAPVGAMLAGPAGFIAEATRLRQQIGGGWRPVGMLAAAALVGLRTMIPRLAQDHMHARRLAQAMASHPAIEIDLDTVQTNIVRGRFASSRIGPAHYRTSLESRGVRIQVADNGAFRAVTYPDITSEMIDRACDALAAVQKDA